ncbi:MAG: hypothetical protein AAGF45_03570 [Pseudomonadota bacterium]
MKRALLKGVAMEVPLLVAGGFYLAATGTYADPLNIILLVVIAAAAGVGAAALAYVKDTARS